MSHLQIRALLRAMSLGLAAASVLMPTAPAQAAGAIRAAYVETVLPGRPFSAVFQPNAGAVSTGPGSGALGVTSLSITSFGTTQAATMVLKVMSLPDGVNCGGAGTVLTEQQQRVLLRIAPNQTLHLIYPSPWVIGAGMAVPAGQHLCLAGEQLGGDGPIYIHVNGFVN
ncbi:MAG: hypothetical protein IPP87_20745 [Ideonella sp.]|nr:hypothetical protein [Ideonella sp.]